MPLYDCGFYKNQGDASGNQSACPQKTNTTSVCYNTLASGCLVKSNVAEKHHGQSINRPPMFQSGALHPGGAWYSNTLRFWPDDFKFDSAEPAAGTPPKARQYEDIDASMI
ncbi:MAG: hypothetical protein AB9872_10135 [Solidesulfovibrio sp.]